MTRRALIVLLSGVAVIGGCTGEPEPFRSKDPGKARAALSKKKRDPSHLPGLPKGRSKSSR